MAYVRPSGATLGKVELLHNSESGISEHRINGTSISYAGELARYIGCPTTIRTRVLEQYDRSPSVDEIRQMQAEQRDRRDAFREAWEEVGDMLHEQPARKPVKPVDHGSANLLAAIRIAHPERFVP